MTLCKNTQPEQVGPRVLLFAEDPGAADYLQALPAALASVGIRPVMAAAGIARRHWQRAGIVFHEIRTGAEPAGILEHFKPAVLVTGTAENPDAIGLALLDAARERSIPSLGVVDSAMFAAYRFRGRSSNPLAHVPDRIAVPDAWTAERFRELGLARRRVAVCGHPQFDRARAMARSLGIKGRRRLRNQLFPQAPENALVCLFAAEISDGFDPQRFRRNPAFTMHGSGRYQDRTGIVLEEFLDALRPLRHRLWLVLRPHPKNHPEELGVFASQFDQVSSEGSPLEASWAADRMVGMTSTILAEAAVMGTPTLAVVPEPGQRDWLVSIRTGHTLCADTRQELSELLPGFLDPSRAKPHPGAGTPWGATARLVRMVKSLIQA